MAILTVSFEISYTAETASTYDWIYSALNNAIKEGRTPSQWWSESTSYYVVNAGDESARDFATRVWNAAGMRQDKDILVVLDTNVKSGVAWGAIKDKTIYDLLPFLK